MTTADRPRKGGEYLFDALVDNGIDLLIGLPGTQTLPLDTVNADRGELQYVMARHETAIPHIAWGYYEAGGTPAATVTVPGPGETNAMHGLKNALEDCVPIVHMTGDTHPDDLGRKPIHEIEAETFDTVVKENVTPTTATDLPAAIERGITRALSPPFGPVRLGIPHRILTDEFEAPSATVNPEHTSRDNADRLDAAADLLEGAERPVVYAGGGARRSPNGTDAVRALVDELDAAVVASYKGKGLFPEDDPRFMGVTGSHLPAGARLMLDRADAVVALGTDFDGVTTAGWELPFGDQLVHVNLDPDAIGASYPADVGIVEDVGVAVDGLLDRLVDRSSAERWDPAAVGSAVRDEYDAHLADQGLLDDDPFTTPAVLRTVREHVPDEAVVTLDVGGFRLWAMQVFEAYRPADYIAAGSWAGMGVGLPAAIGAKLARPDAPVVCLSGDGGLLMCIHELATAVEEDLDIVAIVSNNSDYGIISKNAGIRTADGRHPFEWTSPSYPTIAEGFGWHGESVDSADGLATAIGAALDREGPSLIDVDIPTKEPSAAEAAQYETELDPTPLP